MDVHCEHNSDFRLGKSLQLTQSYLYLMGKDDLAPSEDDMNVRVNQYPQLRQLCWNRPDHDAIPPHEQKLLDRLVAVHGNGHLLAA